MDIIGLFFLCVVCFVIFGLLGWICKALGYVFGFLFEGCLQSIGCLFWSIIIIVIIASLIVS